MAKYKYKKTLLGATVNGYENEREFYIVYASKKGIDVFTKQGKLIHSAISTNNNKLFIHTIDNAIAIEDYNRITNKSNFSVYINDKLIKNSTISGKTDEIIIGNEDVYFKKFDKFQGNRVYYKLYNSKDVAITSPWQYFNHEVGIDEQDRFYCKNYKELSKDEFLEEDKQSFDDNLIEDAVCLSNGHVLFEQKYTEEYENEIIPFLKSLNNNIVLGSFISAVNPVIGSAVMISGVSKEITDKKVKNDNFEIKNIPENKNSESNTNKNSTNKSNDNVK